MIKVETEVLIRKGVNDVNTPNENSFRGFISGFRFFNELERLKFSTVDLKWDFYQGITSSEKIHRLQLRLKPRTSCLEARMLSR